MKKEISIFFLLFCLWGSPAAAERVLDCDFPYRPSNILEVLFHYSGTLEYIANASELCSVGFAAEVREVVLHTWLLTDGCIEATLKDLEKARKENQVRVPRKHNSAKPRPEFVVDNGFQARARPNG